MKFLFTIGVIIYGLNLFGQIRATSELGDQVILYEDGTWEFDFSDNLPLIVEMENPGFTASLRNDVKGEYIPKLFTESQNANKITDEAEWFESNELELDVLYPQDLEIWYQNTSLPLTILGFPLKKIIFSGDYQMIIYGDGDYQKTYLLISDLTEETIFQILDLSSYAYSDLIDDENIDFTKQELHWAQLDGETLYLSHYHRTYSKSSKGQNAYLTSIDLNSLEVLWRSQALTNNASNFLVYDDGIICGYGFTAEDDFIYVLDKTNGKRVQSIPVKSGPEYIIRKEEKIYVRTYDMNYVFGIK